MPDEIDILKAMASSGRPPKNPVRVHCLVCGEEFDSDEIWFDENSLLWRCPHCRTGHTFGQELLPINDTPGKGGAAMP